MSRRTQKIILAVMFVILGAFTGPTVQEHLQNTSANKSTAAISPTEWYPVKKIVDGDTIDVQMSGATVRVRLIGLDTPEVVDPRKPVQCFGKEASNEAKKILTGQSVRLETDPSQGTYDKYGRLLAYVYVPVEALLARRSLGEGGAKEDAPANSDPAGILVNKYMIAEGYGHEYTYDIPYKYQADFKAAEKSARDAQRSLWAPEACINKP